MTLNTINLPITLDSLTYRKYRYLQGNFQAFLCFFVCFLFCFVIEIHLYTYCRSEEMIGFTDDDLADKSFYQFVHPEDLATFAACHKISETF